jgi:hypothetical protein
MLLEKVRVSKGQMSFFKCDVADIPRAQNSLFDLFEALMW